MLFPGQRITGRSGRIYRLLDPLGSRRSDAVSNIWRAVNEADELKHVVVKGPSKYDQKSLGWPLFQHEFQMQKLFEGSTFVRQMTDFVLPTTNQEPVIMLQVFEKTLWAARMQRPMTDNEIKWIMKAVLLGLWTVHR